MDKQSNKENLYFNTLSNVPMFEQGHITNRNFYKTTYSDEFQKKNRFVDNPKLFKPLDFSVTQSYDFKTLSEKLEDKNNQEQNSHEISNNRFLNNQFQMANPYKTPMIPSYIKRDNFFQSNSERNVAYLHTHTGGLYPIIPSDEEKQEIKRHQTNSFENFFADKFTESHASFSGKKPLVSSAKIMSHLKEDNMYHTNKGLNIGYLKTSNGSLITYVPYKEDKEKSADYFNLVSSTFDFINNFQIDFLKNA
ncbi:hypothetical protein BpHYR1_048502 [Brachionus plicatilis]|uniref:Uncharacterized protein n=1 Tax=Brachionus plicatilis TaxID=10195 RepID=A0A3M7SC96_BRAPC|nr:hypothetical protein BpHYR1_048502 [Brachionus plicatilis]